MTDSDGYFSPRNHPQRLVYLPEDPELSDSELSNPEISDSEMEPRERTPLFSDAKSNLPSPPYALGPHTSYGTSAAMGNPDLENSFDAAPPYTDNRANVPHVCAGNCNCGARANVPQDNPPPNRWEQGRGLFGGMWGFCKSRKEHPVSGIAKWLFIRISFVILAFFLLSEVLDVHTYRGPGGRPPPGRKEPHFFECSSGSGKVFVDTKQYTFPDPAMFTFAQVSTQRSGPWNPGHIQVFGDVFVRGVEDLKEVTVDFEFKLSEENLKDRIGIETTDEKIIFRTDRTSRDGHNSCIEVRATISVPMLKPAFGSFTVHTESLDITLEPSLDLDVDNLSLSTHSGDVTASEAYGVDSQSTEVTADSGDITGDFALFDLVSLVTKAGSINAHVIPQPSSNQEAEYIATTISGSIKTTFPKDYLPKGRTYRSSIDSTSGSIKGDYLLGKYLSLSSVNGGISQISVTATGDKTSTLITDSRSGSTGLSFTNNLGSGSKGLSAKHTSISGPVRLEYPRDWEGVVSGKSITGSVNLSGVTIVEDTKWPAGRFVKGVKGAGNDAGSIECNAVSGSISIHVAA